MTYTIDTVATIKRAGYTLDGPELNHAVADYITSRGDEVAVYADKFEWWTDEDGQPHVKVTHDAALAGEEKP